MLGSSFRKFSGKTYEHLYDSGRKVVSGAQELTDGARHIRTRSIPRIWNGWVRPTFRLLMLVRFSLLVAVVLGYVLIANPQAQEVLRALAESSGLWSIVWFAFCALFCSFVAWYWARVAFFFSYEDIEATQKKFSSKKLAKLKLPDTELEKIEKWLVGMKEYLPRLIGSAVLGVIAWGMVRAMRPYQREVSDLWAADFSEPWVKLLVGAIGFSVAAVAFFLICPRLRKWVHLCDGDLSGSTNPQQESDAAAPLQEPNSIDRLWQKTWPFFLAGLALTVGLTVLFAYQAVNIAPSLGTATIGLLFAIALIPNGTFLVLYFGERWGVPVIGFACIWLIAMSFVVDNHRVRQHPEMTSYGSFRSEPARPAAYAQFGTFERYYNAWIEELEAEYADGRPIPVFIVSAEGGGIRAAYWTALVLGELQARSEELGLARRGFARHVFAISGVSGGSLGAATFAGLLAARPDPKPEDQQGEYTLAGAPIAADNWLQDRADCVLSRDFLAPTVAVMLFPDFFQRFYFVSAFNDRAVALEHAWENSWDRCVSDRSVFSEPFGHLWEGDRSYGVPLLFLNSTVVETGQRMISSPLPLAVETFEATFSDAIETNRVLGHEAPLSAVVGTSARFTYVSPAGTIRRLDLDADHTEEDRLIRVVDGGYFENSGAVTASELLSVLEAIAEHRTDWRQKAGLEMQRILPVIIHISNDPIRQDDLTLRFEARAGGFLPELLSPVEALVNSRPARGYQARTSLANRVQTVGAVTKYLPVVEPGGHVHFRLCEYDVPLPLGWVLSDATREEIYAQLTGEPINRSPDGRRGIADYNGRQVDLILAALAGSKAPFAERLGPYCDGDPQPVEKAMVDDTGS